MRTLLICFVLTAAAAWCGGQAARVNEAALGQALVNAELVLSQGTSSREARSAALMAVARYDHPAAADFLLKRLKYLTKEMQYRWLICQPRYVREAFELLELEKAFAKFHDERIIGGLLKELGNLTDIGRLTLLQGLKTGPGKELDTYFFRGLAGRDRPFERIIAIEAAGLRRAVRGLPQLLQFAGDARESFSVRCTAIRALACMPAAESVAPLIACLDDGGRIAAEAHNTLWSITGVRWALKGQWETWWHDNQDKFTPPAAAELHYNQEITGDLGWERFYGIPIVGNRIMFVLDRSGSMQDDDKISGVKAELKRIAVRLTKQKWFNIMFFNQGTRLWIQQKPFLTQVTESIIAQLDSFLGSTSPEGGTKTEEAMYETLITIMPVADIDTVFLLSDGLPNTDPRYVADAIFHMNRYLKVRINTIFIQDRTKGVVLATSDTTGGQQDPLLTAEKFMEGISTLNDGMACNITSEAAKAKGRNP